MPTDATADEPPEAATPDAQPLPKTARRGIGICLSGGGYRATLFHIGGLRRLNELGILARPDFRTVSSVSGGSITAAWLATALARNPGFADATKPIPRDAWDREVWAPLRAFTRKNIRTTPILQRLLPWNWPRDDTAVRAIAARYERDLTPLRLTQMPARPNFVLCATDMAYGVNWVFERGRVGDYQAGYAKPLAAEFPLGRAVAASACFPPIFNPLHAGVAPSELKGGRASAGPERDACIAGLRLTDGGCYDNMGLEPVWKNHRYVLVSDAGGLFTSEGDRGLMWRIPRYQGIQERQTRALRKRWLISNFERNDGQDLDGAYWAVSGGRASYDMEGGYSEELAKTVIAEIRTDLDSFSDAEAAVLENHGYLMADAALRRHVEDLLPPPPATVPPLQIPQPEWMDEDRARRALLDSGRRKIFGRS
jgi:NTE family protein